jgi:hypothetical protein
MRAVVVHQWMVVAVLIMPTIIGCATVLLLAYSLDREHPASELADAPRRVFWLLSLRNVVWPGSGP